MTSQISFKQLAENIRQTYDSDPSRADPQITAILENSLEEFPNSEKLTILEKLTAEFNEVSPAPLININLKADTLSKLFLLLSGKKVSPEDLSSKELLEKLAESTNNIFEMLNQLMGVINGNLPGKHFEEETIRQAIGFHPEDDNQTKSLENYLEQIKKAFLTTQEAFKQAISTKLSEIFSELSPDSIQATKASGIKFGPFRKAELFEAYGEKYHTINEWFESGRFMEDLLKEFEKHSQKFSQQKDVIT